MTIGVPLERSTTLRGTFQTDISGTVGAINRLAAKVGQEGLIKKEEYQQRKQAEANGDFIANEINPDDLVNDKTYARTIFQRKNEDFFTTQAGLIKDAFDDPSNPMRDITQEDYSKHLKTKYDEFVESVSGPYKDAIIADFSNFMAKNQPKLQANHALLRKSVNKGRLITEATSAIGNIFRTTGEKDPQTIQQAIDGIPAWVAIPEKTRMNILMSAADAAGRDNIKTGLDYVKPLIKAHPEYAGNFATAQSAYVRANTAANSAEIYKGKLQIFKEVEAGVFTEKSISRIKADPILKNAYTDDQLLAKLRQSGSNMVQGASVENCKDILKNGGFPKKYPEKIQNKAHDSLYNDMLTKYNGNFIQAGTEYARTVGNSGGLSPMFKDTVKRSLSLAFNSTGQPPADNTVGSLFVAKEMQDAGTLGKLGLSDTDELALRAGLTTLFNSTENENLPSALPQAAADAVAVMGMYKKRSSSGTLPAIFRDRNAFDKEVDSQMDDILGESIFSWIGRKFTGEQAPPESITDDVREDVKNIAWAMGIQNSYDDLGNLVTAALERQANRRSTFNQKSFVTSKPIEDSLGVHPEDLDSVAEFITKQPEIITKFPNISESSDMAADIIEAANGEQFFVVNDKNNPQVNAEIISVKDVAARYHEKKDIEESIKRASEAEDLDQVIAEAKHHERVRRIEFGAKMAFGGEYDYLSKEFQNLYFESPPSVQDKVAAAMENWTNAQRKDLWTTILHPIDSLFGDTENTRDHAKKVFDEMLNSIKQKDTETLTERAGNLINMVEPLQIDDETIQQSIDDEFSMVKLDSVIKNGLAMPERDNVLRYIMPVLAAAMIENTAIDDMIAKKDQYTGVPAVIRKMVDTTYTAKTSTDFDSAYKVVAKNEGKGIFKEKDGKSFMGIYRKYHDSWEGWKYVDKITEDNINFPTEADKTTAYNQLSNHPVIRRMVSKFYETEFYDRMKLNKIKKEATQSYLLDTAVNMGWPQANIIVSNALTASGKNTPARLQQLSEDEIKFINDNPTTFIKNLIKEHRKFAKGLKTEKTILSRSKKTEKALGL